MLTIRKSLLLAALPLSLAASGCSSDDDGDGNGNGGGPTVNVTVTVLNGLTRGSLSDVEVCFDEPANVACVTSDDEGKAAVKLPPNSRPRMKLTRDGYMPVLTTTQVGSEDVDSLIVSVLPRAAVQRPGGEGRALDDAKGQVLFSTPADATGATRVEGVVVETRAERRLLLRRSRNIRIGATATSARRGAMINVPAGTYEATFSHPSKTCTPGLCSPRSRSRERVTAVLEAGS